MNHITIAASEKAFVELFNALRENLVFDKSGPIFDWGPFSAGYDVHAHLEAGSIDLRSDGTIEIKNMDVYWDTLEVQVCFTLPEWCIGGFCLVPDPWNGCLVYFPEICIGGGSVCLPINLSGLVSEINTFRAHINTNYFINSNRQPAWSDLEAEVNGMPNKWQIYLDPDKVSVDPIDVPATISNIVEDLLHGIINDMLSFLPGWVRDLLWALIGPVVDVLKGILGFLDNFEDWVQDLLENYFNLFWLIETFIADYFANQYPLYELEDPYTVLEQSGSLIPVKIPLRNLSATVNTDEMIVCADVG
jgi:hypothetical protein